MKAAAHPQTDWKTKCPPKYLQGLLNGVAVLFFPRGADASVGGEEYSGYVANSAMAGFALSGYALRAHQTRTMKIGGHNVRGSGFCAPFSALFNGEIFVPQKDAGPASCEGLRLRPRNGMRKLRQSGSYAPPRRFPAAPAAVFQGWETPCK